MVPYFGRHPSQQLVRGKPIRWGYKAWVAALPFGYIFSLRFYQEKFRETTTEYKSRFGLGWEVVLDFLAKKTKVLQSEESFSTRTFPRGVLPKKLQVFWYERYQLSNTVPARWCSG